MFTCRAGVDFKNQKKGFYADLPTSPLDYQQRCFQWFFASCCEVANNCCFVKAILKSILHLKLSIILAWQPLGSAIKARILAFRFHG